MSRKRETTYSIYVKFRRNRLTLMRGVRDPADAIASIERLRKSRMHDPQNVILVREPGGEVVDEAELVRALALEASGRLETDAPASASASLAGTVLRAAADQDARRSGALDGPSSEPTKGDCTNDDPPAVPPAITAVLHIRDALDALEQMIHARARFEACLDRAVTSPPDQLELADRIYRLALTGRQMAAQLAEGQQRFATLLAPVEEWLAREGQLLPPPSSEPRSGDLPREPPQRASDAPTTAPAQNDADRSSTEV